jgi:hypothetical protein
MPHPQAGEGQHAQRAQRNESIRSSSTYDKNVKTAAMFRWLDEKPDQEHWNSVGRINGPAAGKGQLKSKV